MAAFSMLPPIAALAWVIGTLRLLAGRGWRHSAGRAYLAASALVATLSGAYLLLEFGENQRFQVEVLYAWRALGVTAAHWGLRDRTWRGRRSRDGLAEQARPLVQARGRWGESDLVDLKEAAAALAERANKTKLTITQDGVPAGEQFDASLAGWNESLDKLEQSLKEVKERQPG